MKTSETAKRLPVARAAALFFAVLLLAACSGETAQNGGDANRRQEPGEDASTPSTTTGDGQETTAEGPPKVTLGEEPGGRPQVVLRLEGGPKTTFSGLCSIGGQRNVLGGKVPKRFTFDPGGRELSCRIQKRDDNRGALKIVLVAGDTTRSVQQTNSPGSTINVTYNDG